MTETSGDNGLNEIKVDFSYVSKPRGPAPSLGISLELYPARLSSKERMKKQSREGAECVPPGFWGNITLLTFHWPNSVIESQIVTRETGKCSFLLRSQIPRYSSIILDEVFRPAISLCQGSIK